MKSRKAIFLAALLPLVLTGCSLCKPRPTEEHYLYWHTKDYDILYWSWDGKRLEGENEVGALIKGLPKGSLLHYGRVVVAGSNMPLPIGGDTLPDIKFKELGDQTIADYCKFHDIKVTETIPEG